MVRGIRKDVAALAIVALVASVRPAQAQSLEILAGQIGGYGNADDVGANARFSQGYGVASNGAGTVYVADTGNCTIRRVNLATEEIRTFTGLAGDCRIVDGIGTNARFGAPWDVALGDGGVLYVADGDTLRSVDPVTGEVTTVVRFAGFITGALTVSGNDVYFSGGTIGVTRHAVYHLDLATATVSVLAGQPNEAGSRDGTGTDARFHAPNGFAVDGAGNLYVSDSGNFTIRKIVLATREVSTFAGSAGVYGGEDGIGSDAHFAEPFHLARGDDGFLFVADQFTVRRVNVQTREVVTLAGVFFQSGSDDGTGSAARFWYADGLALDAAGHLQVLDAAGTLRQLDLATNAVTTIAGRAEHDGDQDGVGDEATFTRPSMISPDGAGGVFVHDNGWGYLRQVDPATRRVTTVDDETLVPASRMVADGMGHVYFTESFETVSQLDLKTGQVTTLAGSRFESGYVDGPGDLARFHVPRGLALDGAGQLYVADFANCAIRQIDLATREVTTLTGSPIRCRTEDGGLDSARFGGPSGLTFDGVDDLYVTDAFDHVIRRIDLDIKTVSTLAGLPGNRGADDGQGAAARFNAPQGIVIDGVDGNVWVADTGNHTIRLIDIDSGDVQTVAGVAGVAGVLPGDLPARLNDPTDITVLANGDLLVVSPAENAVLAVLSPLLKPGLHARRRK